MLKRSFREGDILKLKNKKQKKNFFLDDEDDEEEEDMDEENEDGVLNGGEIDEVRKTHVFIIYKKGQL